MIPKYDVLDTARQFLYLREIAGNHGLRINGIQRWSGGQDGDSYCVEGATFVLDIAYQGKSPLPRMQSCDDVWALAKKNGWVTTTPVPGDIYLRVRNGNDAHHMGFVTQFAFGAGHFGSISFNTNIGNSDDGDGCYEGDVVALAEDVFIHLPE